MFFIFIKFKSWLPWLLLFVLFSTALPQSIVETLPGYSGPLPFKLETGYIGLGENVDTQLFYYFIESESDPVKDPLILWLTGGPGCSGFSALIYEIGPLAFDFEASNGSLPSLILNPYSWTKVASIIFLDSPAGSGFSYSNTSEAYHSSDSKTAGDVYMFLRKWLLKHPNFLKHRLYICGDSYGGKWVPMVVWKISEGNEAGLEPTMFLQGYSVGNPVTDYNIDGNARVRFAHRMALLSDEYYKMAEINCEGNYANPDPKNALCLLALQQFKECTNHIYRPHILEPGCPGLDWDQLLEDDSTRILLPVNQEKSWCRNDNYLLSYVWANDPAVQEALHTQKGTIKEWKRCNRSLSYQKNAQSVIRYHHLLSKKGYDALVYSGDHDMVVPYIGTLDWIRQLNLTVDSKWRQWIVDGQIAGYTERYTHEESQYYLTFATVKGAGHTAPEYKGKQCLAMLERFLSSYPL